MAIPAEPKYSCAGAPAPLPLEYPANLIYAQNMLSMSLSQLQRVETQKAMIKVLLHEQESARQQDAAAAVLTALEPAIASLTGAIGAAHAQRHAERGPVQQPGGVARRWCQRRERARAAQDAPAVAAGAAVPADGRGVAEAPRQYGRRLAFLGNVGLTMLMFGMGTGWFVVFFFLAFLHIAGIFDPMIAWIHRHCGQEVPLEQHLLALRRRQQRAAVAEGGEDGGGGGPLAAPRSPRPAAQDASADAASEPRGAAGTDEATGASGADVGRATAGDRREGGGPAAVQEEVPPYGHRFVYQLVVMFFMTLVPWWTPDPRMVQ